MFSPEELNSVMRLNWPEQRIVHWHPAHLEMIELNKFDAENRELFTNYSQYLSNFVTKGYSFTAMQERYMPCLVYGSCGLVFMRPG